MQTTIEPQLEKLILAELRDIRRDMLVDPTVQDFVDRHRKRPSSQDAIICLAAFVGGLFVQLAALWRAPEVGWPLIAIIAICLLGLTIQMIGISGFSSLMHECWHRYAVASIGINEFIGHWIVAPLFLLDFEHHRDRHFGHHRYVGQDADPDHPVWRKAPRTFVRELAERWLIFPKVLAIFSVDRKAKNPQDMSRSPISRQAILAVVLFHGTWIGLCLLTRLYAVLPAYLLPMILGSTLLSLREYREHFYLEDGRLVTCDIDCSTVERLFIAGGYFNFHATHHVFPELPQRQLPRLVRLISSKPELLRRYHGNSLLLARRDSYFGKAYRIDSQTPLSRN